MGRASAEGAIEQANCNSICVYICVCVHVGVPFSQFDDSNSSKFHVCVFGFFLASACVTVAKSSREAADECVSLCVCVSVCMCVCVCLCIELLLSSGFNVRVWDLLYGERIARVDKQMRMA